MNTDNARRRRGSEPADDRISLCVILAATSQHLLLLSVTGGGSRERFDPERLVRSSDPSLCCHHSYFPKEQMESVVILQ